MIGSGSRDSAGVVSVVAPLHNEGEVAEELLKRLLEVSRAWPDPDIVLVDDGSTDRTFEIAVAAGAGWPEVRVVRLTRNFGQHAAISAGLALARGDVVVLLDGDLQDPPEEIPALLETHERTGADVVYGLRDERVDSLWRRFASFVYKGLLRKALPGNLPPNIGTFRLLTRRVVDAFLALPERGRYVTGLIDWLGYAHAFHPYRRAGRAGGSSSYGIRGLVRLALRGMTSFSAWPIHLCSTVGLFISLASVAVGLFFLVKKLVFGMAVTGFAALIVSITFLGGVQLLFLGLTGLYIARIFDEVKARPIYVIERVARGGGEDDDG